MRSSTRNLMLAMAMTGLSSVGSSIGVFGRKLGRTINYNPGDLPAKVPFSSTRQQARYARQGVHMKMVNGFPLMQTLPSKER